MKLYVDTRSSRLARTTGWERYNREIFSALCRQMGDTVADLPAKATLLPAQIWADWIELPSASHNRTVFFPTFPPSPLTCAKAKKVLYTLHDLTWWRYPETASSGGRLYYRRLAAQALRRSQVVLTPSFAVANELRHSGLAASGQRIETVYPGPMPDSTSGTFAAPRPYLLTVGTLEPRKNLLALFEAYRGSGISSDIDLCVIGRVGWGAARPVPGVRIITNANDSTLAAAYRGALGLAFPSLYEGFGLPLIEAARAGIPVACSDLPVFREVTGGHALFFDPEDVGEIARKLVDLLNAPKTSAAAQAHAGAFSWDKSAEKISRLLSEHE